MYEQISLFPYHEQHTSEPIKEYAHPCGGCMCGKCANNVDCLHAHGNEVSFACFNCDECFYYNGYGNRNKMHDCKRFKITNYEADKCRKTFKIIRPK